ncbi:SDR family NAD(P)-dependent oxidoreductase [Veronia pacifica]|uniref:SDR family oxidoreductase n=1 Tax=Veronia pacifica TaxID=1080227 RepID=A0A1C3EM82_9GAMM|nr:SDR family NAD(P)-dependent oxidoreductase [Veronia pacifica]ODA34334.1 SDR family oxidoreductase [Veronia pacifica]
MDKKLAVITGYGAGLGKALKERFEMEGYTVLGIARHGGDFEADLTDPDATDRVFAEITKHYGTPEIVIHNVAHLGRGQLESLTADDFEQTWKTTTLSAFNVAKSAIPAMAALHRGTVIFTGATASTKGGKGFSPFASAKFALRGLAQSLAREFQPNGIHIAHVILDGIIWSEVSLKRFPNLQIENALLPKDIAEVYLNLVKQPKSTWSHELDLRPQNEAF